MSNDEPCFQRDLRILVVPRSKASGVVHIKSPSRFISLVEQFRAQRQGNLRDPTEIIDVLASKITD